LISFFLIESVALEYPATSGPLAVSSRYYDRFFAIVSRKLASHM